MRIIIAIVALTCTMARQNAPTEAPQQEYRTFRGVELLSRQRNEDIRPVVYMDIDNEGSDVTEMEIVSQ